jgi:hypothetical protein
MNTHQTLSSLSMAVSADFSPGARSFGPHYNNNIIIEENPSVMGQEVAAAGTHRGGYSNESGPHKVQLTQMRSMSQSSLKGMASDSRGYRAISADQMPMYSSAGL